MACACGKSATLAELSSLKVSAGDHYHMFHAVYRIMGERGLTVICVTDVGGGVYSSFHLLSDAMR